MFCNRLQNGLCVLWRLLEALLILVLLVTGGRAQTTAVSGTVLDPNGMPYANGTIQPQLITPGGPTPRLNGRDFVPSTTPGSLDKNGAFSLTVQDNSQITPANTQWKFIICSGPGTVPVAGGKGSQCFSVTLTISGATQDITTQVQAAAPALVPLPQNGRAQPVLADQFASVTAAITSCPAAGCTVDARSPNVNPALGTIDCNSKSALTLLLGPNSYTADHFILGPNCQIIGTAPVNVSGAGTVITSVGANSQPLFVNNTSGFINLRGMRLQNLSFVGAAGNTSQKFMFLDVSGNNNLSVVDHFFIEDIQTSGFAGFNFHLRGTLNSGTVANFIQLSDWNHVWCSRTSSGAECLRIEGGVGQFDCYSCEMDGQAKGDGNNIFVGGTSNSDATFPYSISFYSLTCQSAATCFTGDGFNGVGFYNSHHEQLNGTYLLQASFTNSRDDNFTADHGYFAAVGVNAGNGYIVKATTGLVYGSVLSQSIFTSGHDNTILSTQGAEIISINNSFPQSPSSAIKTTNVDVQLNPAATLNLGRVHTVMLQASATSITTLNSSLGPGETITFFANGACQFATGGNITLPASTSPMVLASGETATFINSDYTGTNTWRLVSVQSLNGAGWKEQRFGATTATAAAAGAKQTTVETWTAAFADASYTVTCSGVGSTGTPTLNINTRNASTVTVEVIAITAVASSFAEVYCLARHD